MSKNYYLHCILLIIVCYTPLQIFFSGSGYGLIIFHFAITLFGFLSLYITKRSFRSLLNSKLFITWLILICYHLVNTIYLKDYDDEFITFKLILYSQLFVPFLAMCISAYATIKNYTNTIYIVCIAFGLNLFFTIISLDFSQFDSQRLGDSFFGANTIGHISLLFSFLISLNLFNKSVKLTNFLLFQTIPFVLIVYTASRGSFVAYLINILGFIHIVYNQKYLIRLTVVASGLLILIYFYLENSLFISRFLEIQNDINEINYKGYSTGTIFDYLGERSKYYYFGFEIFKENPISGIGLWNYKSYSQTYNVLHPEYLIHLTEGGVIAFSLFCIFYYSIINRLIKTKKKLLQHKKKLSLMIYFFISLFTLFLVSRALYNVYIFVIIGIIVGFLIRLNIKNNV